MIKVICSKCGADAGAHPARGIVNPPPGTHYFSPQKVKVL